MTISNRPRILFIDAYDSFSNNIISLLETSLNAEVSTIKIDAPVRDLATFLGDYVAVVAGPGPGDPRTDKDVGLFRKLWELGEADAIPVLGICLGFQSLVWAHGGAINRLPEPRHGIVRRVSSTMESIFRDIPSLETVQYHSLYAALSVQNCVVHGNEHGVGKRLVDANSNLYLTPLAWDHQTDNDNILGERMRKRNPESILMAVKHKKKPFYGIQFHPESICSSHEARMIVNNWWDEICIWRAKKSNKLDFVWNGKAVHPHFEEIKAEESLVLSTTDSEKSERQIRRPNSVISKVISLAHMRVPTICELIQATQGDTIVFDSEKHQTSETGAFSIIGVVNTASSRFEYRIGSSEVIQILNGEASPIRLVKYDNDILAFFESYLETRKADNGDRSIPFWGGLMGYISYEACLENLGVHGSIDSDFSRTPPDLGFVFIERSIVIDHIHQTVHVQSIKPNDYFWIDATSSLLPASPQRSENFPMGRPLNSNISFPDEEQYKSRIRACQAAIRAGNSYELCLTHQANIITNPRAASWPMYNRLRILNPAPFGAYIRLGNLTILSSSPERFLRWSRPTTNTITLDETPQNPGNEVSILQFRPIKGTIARHAMPNSAPRSLLDATRLLSTQKEQAENLMIVDLIRHDLHGAVGSGNVNVPRLMVVEEYETVFQLVSVIEGTMLLEPSQKNVKGRPKESRGSSNKPSDINNRIPGSTMHEDHAETSPLPRRRDSEPNNTVRSFVSRPKPSSPLAALSATLPPGSMTGAPKLRSCQILHSLEGSPRGVYSGIIGYMDVGGGGDWSVAIRCAVRWDNPENATGDHWTVGAGGAVTALSTEQGEWEEMLTKLQATLRIFQD